MTKFSLKCEFFSNFEKSRFHTKSICHFSTAKYFDLKLWEQLVNWYKFWNLLWLCSSHRWLTDNCRYLSVFSGFSNTASQIFPTIGAIKQAEKTTLVPLKSLLGTWIVVDKIVILWKMTHHLTHSAYDVIIFHF